MRTVADKVSFHSRKCRKSILASFLFLKQQPWKIISYLFLRYHGVTTGFGYVKLYGFPIIHKCKGSKIILGKGCTLVSKSKHNFAGINHCVILATLLPGAVIKIGIVGISGSSVCAAKGIYIDDYSGLGANSNIYDTDFHPEDYLVRRNQNSVSLANSKEVKIGKDVWIAANAIILKGVTIGNAAIIGAGAVVTGDVAAHTVYAGNPARKIKDL